MNESTTYWLDRNNKIIKVSNNWNKFALENNGKDVLSEKILGHSLLEYVVGDNTKMWIETLLQLARIKSNGIIKEYRCDSPREKRYMIMELKMLGDGTLKVEHTIKKIESYSQELNFLYSNTKLKSKLYQRCSICNKVLYEGNWTEPNELSEDLTDSNEIQVIYNVCPNCRDLKLTTRYKIISTNVYDAISS